MPTELLTKPLASMSSADRHVTLALSILIERIGQLPARDREDLFALAREWPEAEDRAGREFIESGLQEILTRSPMTTTRIDPNPTPLDGSRKQWALHVGKRIRSLRDGRGLTQTGLAEQTGIPQSHISRLENGEHSANRATLDKIAGALGVAVSQLDPSAAD